MTDKARNIVSVIAVLVIIYGIAANWYGLWPFHTQLSEDNEICAQVITFAINPDTGEVEKFSTPCDVPNGWEIVEADIVN